MPILHLNPSINLGSQSTSQLSETDLSHFEALKRGPTQFHRPLSAHSSFSHTSTSSSVSWSSDDSSFVKADLPSSVDFSPVQITAAAFDGGGVRGAAIVKILQIIMEDVARETGDENVQFSDLFDLVGGTSTGGLVAIMLGLLRVSTKELLQIYSKLSKRLFKGRFRVLRAMFKGSRYSGKKAEREYAKIIAQYGREGEDALMYKANRGGCDVFVTAVNRHDNLAEPILVRSYDPENAHRIVDAACATTAAPGYFPERTLKTGEDVVDGGMSYNNPADVVMEEAARRYGDAVRFRLLLSIGTGGKAPLVMEKSTSILSLVSHIQTMGSIITESERTNRYVCKQFKKMGLGTFVRINVPTIGETSLDKYKNIPELVRATEEYMNTPDMLDIRRELVQILTQNQSN